MEVNCKTIPSGLFKNLTTLNDLVIGNTVETIGSEAFYGCSGLTSVTLSGSVTSIGSSAFQNCKKIIELRLGESVEKIDSKAFDGCPILARIYSEAVFPADCYADAFSMQKTNCKLYVKAGCEDIYRVHKSWCDFDIQTMDGESNYLSLRMGDGGVIKVKVAGQKLAVSGVSANTPVVVYTIHGIQVDSAYGVATFVLDGGVYIVKVGDETFKVSL